MHSFAECPQDRDHASGIGGLSLGDKMNYIAIACLILFVVVFAYILINDSFSGDIVSQEREVIIEKNVLTSVPSDLPEVEVEPLEALITRDNLSHD